MACLERGNNAFNTTAGMKRLETFIISNRHVLRTRRILKPCVLRANARVIQARRHRVGLGNLSVTVLNQVGPITVQHTGYAGR